MKNTNDAIPIKVIQDAHNFKNRNAIRNLDKIYVRAVKGKIENFRRYFGFLSLFIFGLIPWLTFQGQQAILLDFSEQRFRVFSVTFWPQDLVLVAWIFIIAAFLLFFVTSVVGRVWCGFMCPQTVYTFLFIWLEEKIEGSRNKRINLDNQGWTLGKTAKKIVKHSSWICVALLTALTFVGYFVPIHTLFIDFFSANINFWPLFWVVLFTFCTYANAGWMREIMCTHMCPYARFQSAMFDSDTKTVTYNRQRGEGRGPRPKKLSREQLAAKGLGDCIDCSLCVQVCPTGIDIRNGLQYECINCGACVDACNNVMTNMNYSKGLISFTSESALAGKHTKLIRPKVLSYLFVTVIILTVLILQFYSRSELELDVVRDRTSLYRETSLGLIENTYTLKLINKSQLELPVTIQVSGLTYASFSGNTRVILEPGELLNYPVSLSVDPNLLQQAVTPFNFKLITLNEEIEVLKQTTFIYQ